MMGAVLRTVAIGIASDDLDATARAAGGVLALDLPPRESGHYGGDYYRGPDGSPEDVRLYRNLDPVDGSSHFGDARQHPLVLRLLDTSRDPAGLAGALAAALGAPAEVLVAE